MEGENQPGSTSELAQLRELVNQSIALSEQNNYILHRMQFWGRVAFWAKVVLWAIVLLLPVLLYSRYAPFLNIIPGGAGATNASSTSLFGFPSPAEVGQLVHPASK